MEGSAAAVVAREGSIFPSFNGPDEVILTILDRVDVDTVRTLRLVSRDVCGFVDRFRNTIYNSQAISDIARITREKDVLIGQLAIKRFSATEDDDRTTVSVLRVIEVLSHWITKRGIWLDRWTAIDTLHLLADYLARNDPNLEPGRTFGEYRYSDYYEVLLAILNLHVQRHSPQHVRYVREVRDVDEFVKNLMRTGPHFQSDILTDIYEVTMSTHGLRSRAPIAAPTDSLQLESIPAYSLTPWKLSVRSSPHYICSLDKIRELLGAPDLPGDAVFAYGTNLREVHDIVLFEAVHRQGLIPLPTRAFVLENIVVF